MTTNGIIVGVPARPDEGSVALSAGFWLTASLLIGLAVVLWGLHVEEQIGFRKLLPIVVGGFVIHALLPMRLRLPFFLALSFTAIVVILPFPWSLVTIGIGGTLVGMCHLPIPYRLRVALILAFVGVLAVIRGGAIESMSTLGRVVIPVVAAMFMFRLIIYLFDLRNEDPDEHISPWKRLGYFFLLPNVTFLLFPVVDWRTYLNTYYDAPDVEIYRKGVRWMARGALQLLLYRLVYYTADLTLTDVSSLGGLVEYSVATYLLYLRISGQFHMIAGILCLFGFNLPETNHLYFLTTSFTDYWRRANIYWKDFMKKVFYFPSFLWFRRRGAPMVRGVWLGTVVVFVVTWWLHSYQWFWLQGAFPVTYADAAFWTFIGAMVLYSAVREATTRRSVGTGGHAPSPWESMVWATKVVGMFSLLAVLWGMWSSGALGQWSRVVATVLAATGLEGFVRLAGGMVAAAIVLAALHAVWRRAEGWSLPAWRNASGSLESRPAIFGWGSYAGVVFLALATSYPAQVRSWIGERPSELFVKAGWTRLNSADMARNALTYYEGILAPSSYTRDLVSGYVPPPEDWVGMSESDAIQWVDGLLRYELKPDWSGEFKGALLTTNRWGMRDDDHPREKSDDALRIALIGSSYVMGSAVENDQTFGAVLEERLNREHAGAPYATYEVLNFAVGGHGMLQAVHTTRSKVLPFNPDIVLYPMNPEEMPRALRQIARAVEEGRQIDDPYVAALLTRAGVTAEQPYTENVRRLTPYLEEVVRTLLERLVQDTRAAGAIPVAVNMSSTQEIEEPLNPGMRRLLDAAAAAGMVTLRIERPYGDLTFQEARVNEWETHPDPGGHEAYADALYEALSGSDLVPDPPQARNGVRNDSLTSETEAR